RRRRASSRGTSPTRSSRARSSSTRARCATARRARRSGSLLFRLPCPPRPRRRRRRPRRSEDDDMTGVILTEIYVFVLAIFAGYQLISKVPPTLHTPLMSGSNAISGITLLGALYIARYAEETGFALGIVLGFVAVACANINVVGGFGVTERMLKMF